MNAIDFALEFELEGENYYNEQALKAKKDEIRSLFLMLAADEERHYKIIENFKNKIYNYLPTETFKNTPTIFKKLKESKTEFSEEQNLFKVYQKAIEVEIKSREFYKKTAKEESDLKAKEVLLALSIEEDRHKVILENLMDLMRKGSEWVESAEFSHIDESLRGEI